MMNERPQQPDRFVPFIIHHSSFIIILCLACLAWPLHALRADPADAGSPPPAAGQAGVGIPSKILYGWGELDAKAFRAHCQALTRDPHRLTGTPEGRRAGDYIEKQLRAIAADAARTRNGSAGVLPANKEGRRDAGPSTPASDPAKAEEAPSPPLPAPAAKPAEVYVLQFDTPQQIVHVCELRLASGTVPLEPLAANGMQPSVTPRQGILAKIVYVGKGTRAELTGKDIQDSIIVADIDSERVIQEVFRLGAKAIIFLGDGTEARQGSEYDRPDSKEDYKRSRVSVDLPRFYLARSVAQSHGLLAGGQGTLVSQVRWEKVHGRDLFLWIRGTDPMFPDENAAAGANAAGAPVEATPKPGAGKDAVAAGVCAAVGALRYPGPGADRLPEHGGRGQLCRAPGNGARARRSSAPTQRVGRLLRRPRQLPRGRPPVLRGPAP